jgi:hypothetical protein
MDDYLAVVYAAARLGTVEWAPDLATLVARVRGLAPGMTVRLVDGPAALHLAGRPVVGVARVDGRAIFLCGPERPPPPLARS